MLGWKRMALRILGLLIMGQILLALVIRAQGPAVQAQRYVQIAHRAYSTALIYADERNHKWAANMFITSATYWRLAGLIYLNKLKDKTRFAQTTANMLKALYFADRQLELIDDPAKRDIIAKLRADMAHNRALAMQTLYAAVPDRATSYLYPPLKKASPTQVLELTAAAYVEAVSRYIDGGYKELAKRALEDFEGFIEVIGAVNAERVSKWKRRLEELRRKLRVY